MIWSRSFKSEADKAREQTTLLLTGFCFCRLLCFCHVFEPSEVGLSFQPSLLWVVSPSSVTELKEEEGLNWSLFPLSLSCHLSLSLWLLLSCLNNGCDNFPQSNERVWLRLSKQPDWLLKVRVTAGVTTVNYNNDSHRRGRYLLIHPSLFIPPFSSLLFQSLLWLEGMNYSQSGVNYALSKNDCISSL